MTLLSPSEALKSQWPGVFSAGLQWKPTCYSTDAMDPLTSAAASGIQARMEALDMLANNMSNVSTTGFKADREFYSTFAGTDDLSPSVGDEPVIQKNWTDFAQGPLIDTGNKTDLALSGDGFFAVNGPDGALYTRDGSFHPSADGTLVTAQGYVVRATGGTPIQLNGIGPVQIAPDGTVTQDAQQLGQLEVVSFADRNELEKHAGYFSNPDPKNNPVAAATNVQVAQGKLESANSSPAESAARMVTLLRNFEMLQHAVKIGADMNRQAIEEVARVTS